MLQNSPWAGLGLLFFDLRGWTECFLPLWAIVWSPSRRPLVFIGAPLCFRKILEGGGVMSPPVDPAHFCSFGYLPLCLGCSCSTLHLKPGILSGSDPFLPSDLDPSGRWEHASLKGLKVKIYPGFNSLDVQKLYRKNQFFCFFTYFKLF